MNSTLILIIVVVAVALLIALSITFLVLSNKKKSKKLQASLEKYNKEKQSDEEKIEDQVTIPKNIVGENVSSEEIFGDNPNSGFFYESKEEENEEDEDDDIFLDKREDNLRNRRQQRPQEPVEEDERRKRDEEFEQFLDDHAFSRKVFDKTLLEQIQDLPPDVKAIIFGNIFDKYDDHKDE